MSKLSPALRQETRRIAAATAVGVVIMIVIFLILHLTMPERVPFDYRVILGGICGGAVAVGNFFLMGLTVQKVVDTEDQDLARSRMKASYSQRMLLQMGWVVLAIVLPCFQFVAGILPLLFPSLGIKLLAVMGKVETK